MQAKELQTKSSNRRLFIFAVYIVTVLAFAAYLQSAGIISLDYLKMTVRDAGVWGPLIFIGLYGVTPFSPIPVGLMSATGGLLFGPYLGTFYTVIGAIISAFPPFLITTYLGRDGAQRMLSKFPVLNVCELGFSKNGFMTVFFVRMIPLFPWEVVNYVFGLCNISLRDYFLATLLGTIPGSYIYNLLGSTVTQMPTWDQIALGVVLFIFSLGVIFYFNKHKNAPV